MSVANPGIQTAHHTQHTCICLCRCTMQSVWIPTVRYAHLGLGWRYLFADEDTGGAACRGIGHRNASWRGPHIPQLRCLAFFRAILPFRNKLAQPYSPNLPILGL